MKTKKALKLIKEILVLANELQEKQNVMKAVSVPIPDYKKSEKDNLFVCSNGKKEEVVLSAQQWSNSLKRVMRGKVFTFSEAFEKVKAEDPVLKEAYEEIKKSMPFAHPLSEDAKQDDKYFELKRIDNKLADLEITKSSILAIRILVEKGLI